MMNTAQRSETNPFLQYYRGKASHLRQTANANLYHVTKFILYLSPSVHYFHSHISSFTQFFMHKNCLSCFYLLIFYFEKFST